MTYWKPTLVFAAIALAASTFSVASAQVSRGCPVDPSGNPVSSVSPGQLARMVREGTRIGSFVCRDGGWGRSGGRNPPPPGVDGSDKLDMSPPEVIGGGVWHPKPGKGVGPSDAHQPGGEPPGSGF